MTYYDIMMFNLVKVKFLRGEAIESLEGKLPHPLPPPPLPPPHPPPPLDETMMKPCHLWLNQDMHGHMGTRVGQNKKLL